MSIITDRSICTDDQTLSAMTKADNLARLTRQHLSSLRDFGITIAPAGSGQEFPGVQSGDASPAAAAPPPAARVREPAAPLTTEAPVSSSDSPAPPQVLTAPASLATPYPEPTADKAAALRVLQDSVSGCTLCSELAAQRTQTVFGTGNPNARLVLVGEAPGEREDRLGEPFVGAAGQLLDKILAACGLNRRDDVYILNAVKCRPPQNRNPKSEELSNCWQYAQTQLDILQPEFICCLGSVAARTLLQTDISVGRLRKRFHDYRGSKVLVTYHPAYLLRTSSAKKHAWDDMQMLMQAMGIEIPTRK